MPDLARQREQTSIQRTVDAIYDRFSQREIDTVERYTGEPFMTFVVQIANSGSPVPTMQWMRGLAWVQLHRRDPDKWDTPEQLEDMPPSQVREAYTDTYGEVNAAAAGEEVDPTSGSPSEDEPDSPEPTGSKSKKASKASTT